MACMVSFGGSMTMDVIGLSSVDAIGATGIADVSSSG